MFLTKITISLLVLAQFSTSLYSSNSPVVQLGESDFDSKVINSNEFWIIEFYAPWCGHCKSLAPEFEKVAKALKGIVKVGAVDMTVHKSFGERYGVKGFPTLKIFGANKSSPTDYNGGRTASAIVDTLFSQMKASANKVLNPNEQKSSGSSSSNNQSNNESSKVVELTTSNFADEVTNATNTVVMVMFYAPWCGHCKSAKPEYESAAGSAPSKIKFTRIDCTTEQSTCSQYDVKGYPTIKVFINGQVEDYSEARNSTSFLNFATTKLETLIPPKPVAELVSHSVFEEYMSESRKNLFIAFLPDVRDSGISGRKKYIDELKEVYNTYKNRFINILFVEGGKNFALEEKLGLGFGYPALIAIYPEKNFYQIMKSTYTPEGIKKFFLEITNGRWRPTDLPKNLPKFKTYSPIELINSQEDL